jgi:hypothetical protein
MMKNIESLLAGCVRIEPSPDVTHDQGPYVPDSPRGLVVADQDGLRAVADFLEDTLPVMASEAHYGEGIREPPVTNQQVRELVEWVPALRADADPPKVMRVGDLGSISLRVRGRRGQKWVLGYEVSASRPIPYSFSTTVIILEYRFRSGATAAQLEAHLRGQLPLVKWLILVTALGYTPLGVLAGAASAASPNR